MTVRHIDYHDGQAPKRYDDRFACQWHIHYENGWASSMSWCGLDCPNQRERIAREFMHDLGNPNVPDHRFKPDPRWDGLRRHLLTAQTSALAELDAEVNA